MKKNGGGRLCRSGSSEVDVGIGGVKGGKGLPRINDQSFQKGVLQK